MNDARAAAGPDAMTVEELSARAGVPVRTVREYQTWKVLHPPVRVGRRGFYDDSHVRRLEGIARLQHRGYSIAAIRDLFEAWEQGSGLRDVLGLDEAVGVPADEAPIILSRAQLNEILPAVARSERLLRQACVAKVLVRDGDGFLARSPALVQLVADAIDAGISPSAALEVGAAVTGAADLVGRAAADVVAAGSVDARLEMLVRRGRVLLARAVATHVIDRVGHHLVTDAGDDPRLAELVAEIRIGSVARPVS